MSEPVITRSDASRSTQEAEIAVAALADMEPSQVKGFAVVIDDGTNEAKVVTNLSVPLAGALLYCVLELLIAGDPS